MSWPKVAVCFVMVQGSLGAIWLGNDNLAMVLAGAAAGYLVQNNSGNGKENERKNGHG